MKILDIVFFNCLLKFNYRFFHIIFIFFIKTLIQKFSLNNIVINLFFRIYPLSMEQLVLYLLIIIKFIIMINLF